MDNMLGFAIAKSFQNYGIAICISMLVAVLIKVMVIVTSRVEQAHRKAAAAAAPASPPASSAPPASIQGVPEEVVAAISVAVAAITGPHRILHIAESSRSWVLEGRSQLHSHQPKR